MPANLEGYVAFLDLLIPWAKEGCVPEAMILRRLCDWAMVGGFPSGAFITVTGDPVDPFDMFMSCRAAENGFGNGVSLGGSTEHNPLWGLQYLVGVIVSIQDVLAFCDRTDTIPPPPYGRRWGRVRADLKYRKHHSP